MQCRIIDLDSELEEKRRENEKKKADLSSSTNAHLNDPEYRRLEAELQSLDGDVEQKAIAALRNELENLQRRKWMKESSKKRVKLVDSDANFNSRRYGSSFK
uniref:Uncharacterized protein n=1 Tax=Ciona savignyi TaxID=51511 RepID=H2Y7S5_CIOSA